MHVGILIKLTIVMFGALRVKMDLFWSIFKYGQKASLNFFEIWKQSVNNPAMIYVKIQNKSTLGYTYGLILDAIPQ